jgi:predicted O-methyltransferase YrrM
MEIERLEQFKRRQREAHVPVTDDAVFELIHVLIAAKNIRSILEIGTATGVSAMFFAAYMGGGGHVTTVEKDERRYLSALKNIENRGP